MSTFIKHIPCEFCGSKDNAGLYSDGHTHCFGCGRRTLPKRIQTLDRATSTKPNSTGLPYDTTKHLSSIALTWLLKTLTPEEIQQHRILWSNSTQLLIFPFFVNSKLVGWIGRNFGTTGPKYRIQGIKKEMSRVYGEGSTLVFTEDLLSAIVVSRVTAARPLFGTSLNQDYVTGYESYKLWLDKDKRIEAMKQSNKFRQYGINISPVFSEEDPKSYSDKEIKDYLK